MQPFPPPKLQSPPHLRRRGEYLHFSSNERESARWHAVTPRSRHTEWHKVETDVVIFRKLNKVKSPNIEERFNYYVTVSLKKGFQVCQKNALLTSWDLWRSIYYQSKNTRNKGKKKNRQSIRSTNGPCTSIKMKTGRRIPLLILTEYSHVCDALAFILVATCEERTKSKRTKAGSSMESYRDIFLTN